MQEREEVLERGHQANTQGRKRGNNGRGKKEGQMASQEPKEESSKKKRRCVVLKSSQGAHKSRKVSPRLEIEINPMLCEGWKLG